MSTSAAERVESQTADRAQPTPLQCMEIWGGNQAIANALSVPGMDAWVYSEPVGGQRAGGDIHYISTCGGGKIARFAVADVSGHGEAVSALSAELRKLMRRHINTLDQSRFIRALNQAFSDLASGGRFATALLTTYFAPTDHLIVCNAGHPPPLWYRAGRRTWTPLVQTSTECVDRLANLPLGVVHPTAYYQFAVPLERGDLVLIYTDALPESQAPGGQRLGPDGLLELVRGLAVDDPARFFDRLLDGLSAYRGGAPADDDATLILLHHNAADRPRQSVGEMLRVMGKMLHLVPV